MARRQLLWPTLGAPGAVLAGGGIAGIWRGRQTGRKLAVTVSLWHRLSSAQRRELTTEAEVVRQARRLAQVELSFDE